MKITNSEEKKQGSNDRVIQIWTYWHSKEELPKKIAPLVESWGRFENHTVTILDDKNIEDFVARKLPPNFFKLDSRRKSEWVRTAVVYEKGGCWMDASVILLRPLHQFVSFDKDLTIFNQQYPRCQEQLSDFWFFSPRPGSEVMYHWLTEFEMAFKQTGNAYAAKYVPKINHNVVGMPYLFHQLALMVALKKNAGLRSLLHILNGREGAWGFVKGDFSNLPDDANDHYLIGIEQTGYLKRAENLPWNQLENIKNMESIEKAPKSHFIYKLTAIARDVMMRN